MTRMRKELSRLEGKGIALEEELSCLYQDLDSCLEWENRLDQEPECLLKKHDRRYGGWLIFGQVFMLFKVGGWKKAYDRFQELSRINQKATNLKHKGFLLQQDLLSLEQDVDRVYAEYNNKFCRLKKSYQDLWQDLWLKIVCIASLAD
eukprot:240027-Hanusia_phi.AAC.1